MGNLQRNPSLLKEALLEGRQVELEVSSNSMYPILKVGDVIVVEAVNVDQLHCGDCIVYHHYNQFPFWVHRFFKVTSSKNSRILVTKGDARWRFDFPQPLSDNLIGKVVGLRRKGKYHEFDRASLQNRFAIILSLCRWFFSSPVRKVLAYGRYIAKELPLVPARFRASKAFRKMLSGAGPHCLQLATGDNLLPGWINTDRSLHSSNLVYLDLNEPFRLPDERFDFVFCEHAIEHFDYQSAKEILCEVHRVLKPNGVLRIATPDFQFLIDLYSQQHTEVQQRYLHWATAANSNTTQTDEHCHLVNRFFYSWGHAFIYDEPALSALLIKVGFSSIKRVKVGESQYPKLQGIEQHGVAISKEFNELETMVFEVQK